jgi:glycosyltransferase involved in cell wall biosynthesis
VERPVISIITVCKNSAATVGETIRSVLGQQVAGLEYIIVDGGSTDGTQEVVKSFGDEVRVFISEPDDGISDAFNKGIARASGEIVGLINSDDALLPGTLQKVIDFFSQNRNSEVLHGDILFYDGDYFVKRISPPSRWWLPWRMGTFNIHPATFVRRGIYEKYGLFNTTYKFAMDDDLFCKWMNTGVRIDYVPDPLVKVCAGGVSGRFAFKVFGEKRRALLENGFPRIPADVQFVTRCIGQLIVLLQQAGRVVKRKKENARTGRKHGS